MNSCQNLQFCIHKISVQKNRHTFENEVRTSAIKYAWKVTVPNGAVIHCKSPFNIIFREYQLSNIGNNKYNI